MSVTDAYVLSLMLAGQPRENIAWGDTYETTAAAIARGVKANPLFAGIDGEERTAAVLVSLGIFEGALKPNAQGDCDRTNPVTGMCVPGSKPHSFCMFQINESNFNALSVTKDEILTDMNVCVGAALRMAKASFQACSAFPILDRLNQYATGGRRCVAKVSSDKGVHRMRKALWLFEHVPRTTSDAT